MCVCRSIPDHTPWEGREGSLGPHPFVLSVVKIQVGGQTGLGNTFLCPQNDVVRSQLTAPKGAGRFQRSSSSCLTRSRCIPEVLAASAGASEGVQLIYHNP